jgi:hypothetical protein
MDTRFWGPDGWLLLHTLTYHFPEKISTKEQYKIKNFFNLTSKILPCKYCRISMQKFMKQMPIDTYLSSRQDLIKWLYKLHNKVNNKLRRQGYCITRNPNFNEVDYKFNQIKLQLDNNKYINLSILEELIHDSKVKKCSTKKKINCEKNVKKSLKNFKKSYISNSYNIYELLFCNRYIGSIIFNYPNFIKNYINDINKCNNIYIKYINSLLELTSHIDLNATEKIKHVINKNDIFKVLKKVTKDKFTYNNDNNDNNVSNLNLNINCKIDLYNWYFDICKKINPDFKEDYKYKNFCNNFKKYIVKTCNDGKTINEKVKKENTCRKQITHN